MSRPRQWLILAAITLTAMCLAVIQLGYEPLWLDEALTFFQTQLSAGELVASLRGWHPPLYFGLLKIWIAFGNSSEFWIRLFSALCFALTVPVVYVIGRTVSGRRAGLYAACLAATAPFLIRYAQEARPYALLLLLCSLALMSVALIVSRQTDQPPPVIGAGLRGRWRDGAKSEHRGRRDDALWGVYIAAALGAMFTHHTGLLLPVVTTLIFLAALAAAPKFRWLRLQNVIAANAAALTLYIVYIPLLLSGIEVVERQYKPALISPLQIVKTLVRTYANEHVPLQFIVLAALCAVALWGWRRPEGWKWMGFTLAGVLGFPMILLAMSAVLLSMFLARVLIWAAVPFYVACAVGLARLPGAGLRRVVLGGLLLCNLYGILNEYRIIREPWDQMTEVVTQAASSDDAVALCPAYIVQPFNYYWRRYDREIEVFDVWKNSAARPFLASAGDDVSKWRMMKDEPRDLASLLDDYSKLWLAVYSDDSFCNLTDLRDRLSERGRLVEERGFGDNIKLLVFVRSE